MVCGMLGGCLFWNIFSFREENAYCALNISQKCHLTSIRNIATGDLMAHATNDIKAIQRVAGTGVLQFADALLTEVLSYWQCFYCELENDFTCTLANAVYGFGARILSKNYMKLFLRLRNLFLI